MGDSNLHVKGGFAHFMKSFVPFLATFTLIYSSKGVYVFLIEGHHTDAYTIFLRMIQSAAFVAPAATHLVEIGTCGYMMITGTCLTILGLTLPLLIADVRTQGVAFAVLYGSGTSIMFQATITAVSAVFRANIASSAVILSLSAVVMVMSQQLLDKAISLFPGHITHGLLAFLSLTCLVPAFVDVLQTRRLHKNEKVDTDTVWQKQINSAHEELEFDVGEVSLTASKADSVVYSKHELMWKFSAILWWATGVHLCCFITSSRDTTTITSLVSLVCILSLAAFVVKGLLSERMAAGYSEDSPWNNAGFFILGLLGIGSLMLKYYPHITDVRCYALLFVMSYFYQLKHDGCHNAPKNSNVAWHINQCIELIFTLFAMVIGYLAAYIVYNRTVPPGLSRLFPGVCLPVLATAMILVSVRYSIKGDRSTSSSCNDNNNNTKNPDCVIHA